MPKAACPACKTEVKYAKDAEVGSTVTCPDCDEVFTPPKLMQKGAAAGRKTKYNPEEDEDTFKVGRADTADEEELDKSRHASAAMAGARRAERMRREMAQERRRFWFDGPEIWLLIFGIGAGVGLPFGLWLARNWTKMSDAKVFWIFVALILVGLTAVGLGGSAWAWLRRNR